MKMGAIVNVLDTENFCAMSGSWEIGSGNFRPNCKKNPWVLQGWNWHNQKSNQYLERVETWYSPGVNHKFLETKLEKWILWIKMNKNEIVICLPFYDLRVYSQKASL